MNHRARERQLEQQLLCFQQDLDKKLRNMGASVPKVTKLQLRAIAIYSYKRGRLDR